MSRESNRLQRHIEESLAEREASRKWIREAEERSPWITVTEQDWEQYGHMSVYDWLVERNADDFDPRDDWDDCGILDDEVYDYCSCCGRIFDIIGGCHCVAEEFEHETLEAEWYEETHEEYGGRTYPKEHVQAIREHEKGEV